MRNAPLALMQSQDHTESDGDVGVCMRLSVHSMATSASLLGYSTARVVQAPTIILPAQLLRRSQLGHRLGHVAIPMARKVVLWLAAQAGIGPTWQLTGCAGTCKRRTCFVSRLIA